MVLTGFLSLCVMAAQATPVRPAVTGVMDARAVHLLFGPDGETVSSCVPTTDDGWSCGGVDVESLTDIHLLVDTKLYPLGPVEVKGPDLTVDRSKDAPVLRWTRVVEPVEGRGNTVVVIRIRNPKSDRAPMIHLLAGTINKEVGCADDGRFPDTLPNDGLFHCATTLKTSAFDAEQWSLDVSMRTQAGEVDQLGNFTYSGTSGLRFASVTVGDLSAASSESFVLVGPSTEVADDGQEPSAAEVEPASSLEHTQALLPGIFSSVSSALVWVFVLLAAGVGWLLGSRVGPRRTTLDEATPLAAQAIDGRGPLPDCGVVVVSSASPSDTLVHVMQELTVCRRVVIVGEIETAGVVPAHSILQVTDSDKFAIQKLIRTVLSDGGLPPVLLILGSDAVLDTGGASPTPTDDLLAAVQGDIWSAVFLTEDEKGLQGFEQWGHDPQAGWTRL